MERQGRLDGRTVLITGATSGLGLASAEILASFGARVVLATRNRAKTDAVIRSITERVPDATLEHLPLDLTSLRSVRDAADSFLSQHDQLHILLNNAGVIGGPRARTQNGFEAHIGTNHLGHFALTGLLLPGLMAAASSRVVIVSSSTHKLGRISREDLMWERRRYSPWGAYAQSKVAVLLFMRELDKRLRSAGVNVMAVGAHPGVTPTHNRDAAKPEAGVVRRMWGNVFGALLLKIVGQPLHAAVLPQVHAAVEDVDGGTYWGPSKLWELKGSPGRAEPSRRARNDDDARWLWERSAELTGVRFEELSREASCRN